MMKSKETSTSVSNRLKEDLKEKYDVSDFPDYKYLNVIFNLE